MNTHTNLALAPMPELASSPLLDYTHPAIEGLIRSKGWNTIQDDAFLIREIFLFVRDEIAYGYTKSFAIPASRIVSDRMGNGITKSTLFMALLRAVGIPCRFQALMMHKIIFRGLLSALCYRIAGKYVFRARVELQFKETWYPLEGHIIDSAYMQKLQQKYPNQKGSFYGYGVTVLDFRHPENRWSNNHVFVQNRAIEETLGTFDTPDDFFCAVPKAESSARSLRYRTIICSCLNRSIQAVRDTN